MKVRAIAVAMLMLIAPLAQAALTAPAVDGAKVGEWTMDVDAAKALAAERGLPLFLNFTGSDWCGWCKLMDKSVFGQAEWRAYATQSLVLVWIDFPQDEELVPERYRKRNKALSDQYGVEGYPTYIVLDSDGRTELGRLGADRGMTPAKFIAQIEDTFGNRTSAVKAMIDDMGPEKGAAYQQNMERLAAARAEHSQVEAESQEKLEKLAAEIAALEEAVDDARTDWKLSKLTDAQRAAYGAAGKAYDDQFASLQEWINSDPEQSDENRQKYEELTGKLQELSAARDAALRGE